MSFDGPEGAEGMSRNPLAQTCFEQHLLNIHPPQPGIIIIELADHGFYGVQNIALVEAVTALADKRGCTPGQLALAWVHAQGDDVFPIPGTKRVKYLEENVAAFSIKLTKQELSELESVFAQDKVRLYE